MDKTHILLIIISFFVWKHIACANADCSSASCGPNEPEVRFPFRILDLQPAQCGYPGFELSCDRQNQTILQLPSSFPYIVKSISYLEQIIHIDPGFCQANRIIDVNITDTAFGESSFLMQNYTFYNCLQNYSTLYPYVRFPCLSSENYSVIAMVTDSYNPGYAPTNCEFMKRIVVPILPNGNIREALDLLWLTPYCITCEREGKVCESKSDDGDTICVNSSRGKGISRGAIYGLSIGIGVPALICLIGLAYYAYSKVQGHNSSHNRNTEPSSVSNLPQPASGMGLAGPMNES